MDPVDKRVKLTGPWKVRARVGPLSRYLSLDPPRLLKALSSRDMTTRFNAWRAVPILLKEGKLKVEDVKPLKGHFFEVLKSRTDLYVSLSWQTAVELAELGVITREDSRALLELLLYPRADVRKEAWLSVPKLVELGVITPEEIKERRYCLFPLLARDVDPMFSAWGIADYLLDMKAFSRDDAPLFLRLLKSGNILVRQRAWVRAKTLTQHGVLTVEELKRVKRYFIEALKYPFLEVEADWGRMVIPLDPWSVALELLNAGVLEREDLLGRVKHFLEALDYPNPNFRLMAWWDSVELVKAGLIGVEALRGKKLSFLQIAVSLQGSQTALREWREVAEELVKVGVLSREDLEGSTSPGGEEGGGSS